MSELAISAAGDSIPRRNAVILAAAAAFVGAVPTIAISTGGLAGLYLLGPNSPLATLPVSFYIVGSALGAWPAAMLMKGVGRRNGFLTGTSITALGGAVAGLSVFLSTFIGLLAGFALVGFANAFVQQYRFAAADSGSEGFRAKAISWVLAGGILAAIIGPQTVIFTRNLFNPVPFVGAYFAICGLAAVGALLLLQLTGAARAVPSAESHAGGRPLSVIVRQPRFLVALVCAVGAYALMSLVMTAAPLAMVACGLGGDNAALGIQWHVLAMFGPSFFTGALIARFGKELIVGIGLVLIVACGVVALTGVDLAHFWGALILVGLGWNFGFIGATAMLTETYRPEERAKVQGFNDSLLFGFVAVASFSSGALFSSLGWEAIGFAVFPVVGLCFVALVVAVVAARAPRAAA